VPVRLLTVLALLAALVPSAAASSDPPRHLDATIVPDDTLFPTWQWYLQAASGVDAFPLRIPDSARLRPVTVAVVDGGIDPTIPELRATAGHPAIVVDRRSFVPGQPVGVSTHGTLVAGLIAARTRNAFGFAAPGLSARLLDLQVVSRRSADRDVIDPAWESAAIHYAVDHGARVVNLSLSASRNPSGRSLALHPDAFSPIEAAAVRYAVRRGALVVASAGNDHWRFVDWPAALPHVVAVSAVDKDRHRASFSNADPMLNDLTAPGVDIASTVPGTLDPNGLSINAGSSGDPDLALDGTTAGTSFSAPLASAAAALLFALRPSLQASQVETILAMTARDLGARGRDSAFGSGELDVNAAVARALNGPLPTRDGGEPNDDVAQATPLGRLGYRLYRASASRWSDRIDVYSIRVRAGQRIGVALRGLGRADLDLLLFRPGTRSIEALDTKAFARLAGASLSRGGNEHLLVRARTGGTWYVAVVAARGRGGYNLVVRRR
jgi:subtilisin family serine protease